MQRKTRRGFAALLAVIGLGTILGSLNGQWLGYPWAYVADAIVLLVCAGYLAWETR